MKNRYLSAMQMRFECGFKKSTIVTPTILRKGYRLQLKTVIKVVFYDLD